MRMAGHIGKQQQWCRAPELSRMLFCLRRNDEKQTEDSAEGKKKCVERPEGSPMLKNKHTLRPERGQWEERGTSITDSITDKL